MINLQIIRQNKVGQTNLYHTILQHISYIFSIFLGHVII